MWHASLPGQMQMGCKHVMGHSLLSGCSGLTCPSVCFAQTCALSASGGPGAPSSSGGPGAARMPPVHELAHQCSIVIFDLCIADVLSNSCWEPLQRDLDVLEVWSGVASVQKAAASRGLTAAAIDIDYGVDHNLLSSIGFCAALRQTMRLRPGGLLAMAPVCSSFTFPNISRTKRSSQDFSGDPENDSAMAPSYSSGCICICRMYELEAKGHSLEHSTSTALSQVRDGNHMAEVAAFLFIIAVSRGVHAFLENPAGSMMFSYLREHFEPLHPLLATSIADRCHYSDEPMGERFLKPFKFLASGRWIHHVNGRCACVPQKHIELMKVDDKGRVSGTPALKASQAYPRRLGEALVSAWANSEPVPKDTDPGAPGASSSSGSSGAPGGSGAASQATAPGALSSRKSGRRMPQQKRSVPTKAAQPVSATSSATFCRQTGAAGAHPTSPGPWAGSEASLSPERQSHRKRRQSSSAATDPGAPSGPRARRKPQQKQPVPAKMAPVSATKAASCRQAGAAGAHPTSPGPWACSESSTSPVRHWKQHSSSWGTQGEEDEAGPWSSPS